MLGWVTWAVLLLLAIGLTGPVMQGALRSFGYSVLLWWILLAWTVVAPLQKWNIVWLAPLATVLPTGLLLYYATRSQRGPGMIVWALTFVVVLAFITFWPRFSPRSHSTPWLVGFLLGGCIVVARILTNRSVVKEGTIPRRVSLIYSVGFYGLIVACIASLVTAGWRAAVPLMFAYLLTEFVPSALRRINA